MLHRLRDQVHELRFVAPCRPALDIDLAENEAKVRNAAAT